MTTPGAVSRSVTDTQHATVMTVVELLGTDLTARLTLGDLADAVGYSPFHLARLFRTVVGIPPGEFRAALRFDQAKRLLVHEGTSVTDACFGVGFDSLGTFSTRFRKLVGVSPQQFVRLPDVLDRPASDTAATRQPCPSRAVVRGHVLAPEPAMVYVGLFPHAIAQSHPVTGAFLMRPGPFELSSVPPGAYRLLAAGIGPDANPLTRLVPGSGMTVGAAPEPVVVRTGTEHLHRDVQLRAQDPCEPPVLVALAVLA